MAYAPNILAGRNFLLEAANRKSNGATELELAVHMACELYPDQKRRQEYVGNRMKNRGFSNPYKPLEFLPKYWPASSRDR